jgi:hypothetical protein
MLILGFNFNIKVNVGLSFKDTIYVQDFRLSFQVKFI